MKLTCFGAAGEVTGSQHLIECGKLRILLDCGLFQGRRAEARAKNERFHCRPADLDAVILSHAHIDHCGNLPGLYRAGFRGPIYCTEATADVAEVMLEDSAKIQAEDARYLNRKRPPGVPPIEPLYDFEHVAAVVKRFEPFGYGEWQQPAPELRMRLQDAGHILGSAIVELEFQEKGETVRVVFTGDLGRRDLPLLHDPVRVKGCDVLITESTYGHRVHPPPGDLDQALAAIIERAVRQSSRIIIPAFALGRTQQIVYALNRLKNQGRLGTIPVYVDSPLSNRLTNLHRRYAAILDSQVQAEHLVDKDVFGFAGLHYVSTQQESMELNGRRGPMIIIAASGMCESGRVLHHLKHAIEDPETTVLIIGFQAQNTLGRRIVERAPYVRIFDQQYALRAQVETLNGFSGHADAHDFRWWFDHLGSTTGVGQAFIVHGEQEGASAVQAMLRDVCDEDPVIAEPGRTYEIGKL